MLYVIWIDKMKIFRMAVGEDETVESRILCDTNVDYQL